MSSLTFGPSSANLPLSVQSDVALSRLCNRPAAVARGARRHRSLPMILYPAIDLKDGQCVRLLHGEMDKATVFGDDPAAQALRVRGRGLRMAAPRRPQRRLRRCSGERGGGRGDPRPRSGPLPARRRHPRHGHDRDLARPRASPGSSSAPSRSKTRHWCARRPSPFPARSPSASTPAKAASRPRAGPRRPTSRSPTSPVGSKMPVSPRSSTPTSCATAR